MNYIKRLEDDVRRLKREKQEALDALVELYAYLYSAKFRADTTVQKQDVLNRMEAIKWPLLEAWTR